MQTTTEHTLKPPFKNRHCTMNMFSSLHAVLQSQKDTTKQGKAEKNKDDQRYEMGSDQGTK